MNDGLSMMERYERTGSFLPKGVACAISEGYNGLRFITYAQLKQERIARQKQHLEWVLRVAEGRRAGFVWTFWCPGLGGFAYRGWWAYLRILGRDDYRLGFDRNPEATLQAMRLFPCGVLPERSNFDLWKEAFARAYRRRGRFRRQGLAPVWVTLEGDPKIEPAHDSPLASPKGPEL